ncbi:MAG: GNAT family N-acetyltransferase [Alistipes sp.]|nr:GNAT family N-acetyltransferase [Alistipes sp.]
MAVCIEPITRVDEALIEALQPLMQQLNPQLRIVEQELERMLQDPRCHLLVARCEGQIVGMLTWVYYDTLAARRGWVEDVVTLESFRGRGVGRALVEEALKGAQACGVECLSLTSSAHRQAAHALYRKMDFQPVETTLFRQNPLERA